MSDDKKNVNDKISELFGVENDVENLPIVSEEDSERAVATIKNSEDESKLEQDFELSRSTLHNLITQGEGAIEKYLEVVVESDSPRAYEVLAKLLDAVASLSKDNVELHSMKRNIKEKMNEMGGRGAGSMNIKNANIIVGTTADLQKQIKNEKTNEDQ